MVNIDLIFVLNLIEESFPCFQCASTSALHIIIIIISLTSIFFQDKSRVWTAASQQH